MLTRKLDSESHVLLILPTMCKNVMYHRKTPVHLWRTIHFINYPTLKLYMQLLTPSHAILSYHRWSYCW